MTTTAAPRFTLRSALDDAKPKISTQQPSFTVPSLSFAAPPAGGKGNISQGFDYPKAASPPMQSPPPMYSQPTIKPFPTHIQAPEPPQQPSYFNNQSFAPQPQQTYFQPVQQQFAVPAQSSAMNGHMPHQTAIGANGFTPQSAAMAQQEAVDRSTEPDTIRAKFHEFVVAPIDTDVTPTLPHCLAVRGMEKSSYSSVILRVRQVKKTNQINKGVLWTTMILLFNLTGYLLVEKRLVGNTRLSAKLLPILHEANTHLVTSGINARFVWTNGELRVHYK